MAQIDAVYSKHPRQFRAPLALSCGALRPATRVVVKAECVHGGVRECEWVKGACMGGEALPFEF